MEPLKIDLIAINITKTAGMSFRYLLKQEYGNTYYRKNISEDYQHRSEAFCQHLAKMPAETRVVHGHFCYKDVFRLHEAFPHTPVVTWLREPV